MNVTLPPFPSPGAGSSSDGATITGIGLGGGPLTRVAVDWGGRPVAVGDGSEVSVRVGMAVALGVEEAEGVADQVTVAVRDGRGVGVWVSAELLPSACGELAVFGVSDELVRSITSTALVVPRLGWVCASDGGRVVVSGSTCDSSPAETVRSPGVLLGATVGGVQEGPFLPSLVPEARGTTNPTTAANPSARTATMILEDRTRTVTH